MADYVYCDGLGSDGFILESELADVLFDMEPKDRPQWVWACKEIGLRKLDATDLVAGLMEDHHESQDDQVDVEGLQEVLDAWHAKQSVISYEPDETKAVMLDTLLAEVAKMDEENAKQDVSESAWEC